MDLPLNLCFATLRGDDLVLHQLLKRGLDPNESDKQREDSSAASKGSENCVLLLLDYGSDPNSKDSDGIVPLWEAMVGGHEKVAKLLIKNGANINAGDIGHFACTAAEQNNLDLLKEILTGGGDVTRPRSYGTTALHVGADIDKPDANGWTARDLAEQQGHDEIKTLSNTNSLLGI